MGEDVVIRVEGALGRISLNRPQALNALTADMCLTILEALEAWLGNEAVRCILVDHEGERGFCAGGDVRRAAESGAGDGAEAARFFRAEYRMNELLHRYPKPTVAFMDGVTMGGGVGLSRPASWRIATERTVWAMPEGDIGLFPDVGCGYWLARLPGEVGTWLALTGARLGPADCLALDLATHIVQSDRLSALKQTLCGQGADLEAVLAGVSTVPAPAPIHALRDDIDRLFAFESVEQTLEALRADGSDWALRQVEMICRKCPTTLKVALRLLREGRHRVSFAEEMQVEYRLAVRMTRRHDFIDGVRAVLVDKDGAPRWSPDSLQGVGQDQLDLIFSELAPDEEWTPLG